MERVCFTMTIAPEHLATYVEMHARVWPELLRELDRTGWSNYSLFLRSDGLLVGYLEVEDWVAAAAAMALTDVASRWSVEMDRLMVPGSTMNYLDLLSTTCPPVSGFRPGTGPQPPASSSSTASS